MIFSYRLYLEICSKLPQNGYFIIVTKENEKEHKRNKRHTTYFIIDVLISMKRYYACRSWKNTSIIECKETFYSQIYVISGLYFLCTQFFDVNFPDVVNL